MQKGHARKKNYPDKNSYHCFNVIACSIHVEKLLSATHYIPSSCVIVSGVWLALGGDANQR